MHPLHCLTVLARLSGLVAATPAAAETPTRNGTPAFKRLYREAEAGHNELPPEAASLRYLFVGGAFSNYIPSTFNEGMARLRSRGLDTRRVAIHSERSALHNARIIRTEIRRAAADGKKVILIGHSKGGVDIATALQHDPRLLDHVAGVVAFQSPVRGSRLAEILTAHPRVRQLVGGVLRRIFGGDVRMADQLTPTYREAFTARNSYPEEIPTLSIIGRAPGTSPLRLIGTLFRLPRRNDGLVAPREARAVGSTVVRLAMDHGGPVLSRLPIIGRRPPGSRYDAGLLAEAAVSQVLGMRASARSARLNRTTARSRKHPRRAARGR